MSRNKQNYALNYNMCIHLGDQHPAVLGASEHSKDGDTGWIWASREPCRGQWSLYLVQSAAKLDRQRHPFLPFYTPQKSTFQYGLASSLFSQPSCQVPFSKLSAGQTSRRSRSTQEQRSVQQIAWLALNIWDLPEQSAQWFEKAVSPVETASMSGVEKLFFSRFIPVVTG